MKIIVSSSPNRVDVCSSYLDLAVQHKVWLRPAVYCVLCLADRDVFGLRIPTCNWCWQRRQNRGHAALSFGLTGPVTALLTLRRGVICAGTAAIIHLHRPVTPYKQPCWCKQREVSPLTTALKGTLRRSCVEDVTFPDLQPLTCVHHLNWTRAMCV